jgi:hypothetical protein
MFSILLGLTPDNFTCPDESAVFGIQVVNQSVCILMCYKPLMDIAHKWIRIKI